MTMITIVNPNYVRDYRSSLNKTISGQLKIPMNGIRIFPIDPNIVARVQPRASKGHHGPVIATLFRLLYTQGVPNKMSHIIKKLLRISYLAIISLVS